MNNESNKVLFGGKDADQYHLQLHAALTLAATDYAGTLPEGDRRGTDVKSVVYPFVEEIPATSMVVELVNALNTLGYKIVTK